MCDAASRCPVSRGRTRRLSDPGISSVLLSVALVACGPPSTWRGVSPDHRTSYEVAERDGRSCVAIGTASERCFDGVSVRDVTFSPDSRRTAYPVQDGGIWRVVIDGKLGPPVDGVGDIVFNFDGSTLAYTALRQGSWHVVVNGRFSEAFEWIYDESLTFSPAGNRLAYAAHRDGLATVVVDGRVLSTHDGVGAIRFDPGGARVAHVARDAGRASLVVDGSVMRTHDQVTDFRFSPSGDDVAYAFREGGASWVGALDRVTGPYATVSSLAYPRAGHLPAIVVRRNSEERVVFGERESDWYASVEPPVFDRSGHRWGFVAHDTLGSVVVLDGAVRTTEEWASGLTISVDGGRYAYLAKRGGLTYVVHDEGERGFDLVVPGTLLFLQEEGRWACLAGNLDRRELFVVVENLQATRPFDWAEAGRLMTDGRAGSAGAEAEAALRAWVAAEARILLGLP